MPFISVEKGFCV